MLGSVISKGTTAVTPEERKEKRNSPNLSSAESLPQQEKAERAVN